MSSEDGGHGGQGLGLLVVLNTLINAAINGAVAWGIAWIHTNPFTIDWYHNEPTRFFEETFVVEDIVAGTFLTGLVVTVIVGLILYRMWDKGEVAATTRETMLLSEKRSRPQHLLITGFTVGVVLALFALLNILVYNAALGLDHVAAAQFTQLKIISGVAAGGIAGAVATVSIVVNLSRGKLVDTRETGSLIGRLSLWSSENNKKVIAAVLVLTILLGSGIADIHTNVDVADVLPRGNPNTDAAKNITDEFESGYTQQVEFFFHVDEDACLEDSRRNIPLRHQTLTGEPSPEVNCGNITDEVYIRAVEEFYEYLTEYTYKEDLGPFEEDEWGEDDGERIRESPFVYQIGLPSFFKLINWTVAGGQDDAPEGAFGLPDEDQRHRWNTVNETMWAAIESTINPTLNPTYDQAVMLYLVPTGTDLTQREIGEAAINAREDWNEWAKANADYKVFTGENQPTFAADPPVANAHASSLLEDDFAFLGPIILYVLIIALFLAFRNIKSVLIAGSTMGLGVVWTYGLMGHLDIAMNPLNLTVLPLIMGNGVDYAIHMINEFLEHKSEGYTDAEAFLTAGNRAGFAMMIATITTVVGLTVMMLSPSLLLAQLGLLAAVAMTSVYLLTVAFIPAILTMVGGTEDMGSDFRPSKVIPAMGRFIHRFRGVFAALLIVVSILSYMNLGALTIEEFGEPGLNFPEGDWLREEHTSSLQTFYGTEPGEPIFKTNVVVVEGDVEGYDTHRYIDNLTLSLGEQSNQTEVLNMDTSRDLPFLIRTWLKVKDGPESVATGSLSELLENQGYRDYSEYPKDREAIHRTIDEIFASPLSTFSSLFVNHPENNITVVTIAVKTGSFDNAEMAWDHTWEAIDRVDGERPSDVTTAFVGNTPTNYLFIQEELPWLTYMSYASFAVVVLLVLAFTRDLKATLAVGLLVGLTSLWLMAILPLLGIGLAITLMLPLVFIFSIGSDYAVHMIWNIKKVGNVERVYETVGKAIMYSAITDMSAFLLFTNIPGTPFHGIRDLMVQKAMVATVVAIGIIFIGTIVITSILYDPSDTGEDAAAHGAEAPSTPDTRLPKVTVRAE